MKIFFRLLSLLLAFIICCGCFIACKKEDDGTEETELSTESSVEEGFTINGEKESSTNELVSNNASITVNGQTLDGYTVIYDADCLGLEKVATKLANKMVEFGYDDVRIASDEEVAETDGAKEILIGTTNRKVSNDIYEDKSVKLLSYKLVVNGSYLQVACAGAYSGHKCVEAMQLNFFEAENKTFTDGEYMFTDLNEEENEFTEGTDLRLMTSNVRFAYDVSGWWHYELRCEVYASLLTMCKPDAIGIQEADTKWIAGLPYYLDYMAKYCDMEYEWIFEDWRSQHQINANVTNGNTTTSIIYRSDKYDLVDSDIENCAWYTATHRNIRLVCWALLQDKVDPTHQFIIMNTHWGFNTEAAGQAGRDQSVALSTDKVNYLKETYLGVPIFHTGDFNSPEYDGVHTGTEQSEYTEKFLPNTGCKDSMLAALEKGVRVNNCGGMGGLGVRDEGGRYVDHIAIYGDLEILKFETVITDKTVYMSDHSPMIADYDAWR